MESGIGIGFPTIQLEYEALGCCQFVLSSSTTFDNTSRSFWTSPGDGTTIRSTLVRCMAC